MLVLTVILVAGVYAAAYIILKVFCLLLCDLQEFLE